MNAQVGSITSGVVDAPNTVRNDTSNVAFQNENYTIRINDTGEVLITNKGTNETYRIWGDPHVEIDGKQAFDFWGQTTFQLQDGTKVTIETTPWKGGDGKSVATISSKVTITDGDYAAVITGVDDNRVGDLNFVEYQGTGQLVDAKTSDGNVIYENPFGAGFVTRDGSAVDQDYINSTDLLKGGMEKPARTGASASDARDNGWNYQDMFRNLLTLFVQYVGVESNESSRRERTDLIQLMNQFQWMLQGAEARS